MNWFEPYPRQLVELPKFLTLRRSLNWSILQTQGFLYAFWDQVFHLRDSGEVSDWTAEYLAERTWLTNASPQRVLDALVANNDWIEVRENGCKFVRDWPDIAGERLIQKYKTSDRPKLVYIWGLYGRIYGERRGKSGRETEGSGQDSDELPKGSDPPSFLLPKGSKKEVAPPDIIKEPPKDGEEEEEGNRSSPLSWETEREEERATQPSQTSRTPIEVEDVPEVERRDGKTRPEVHLLLDRFHDRLADAYGEAPSFAYGPWGKYIKMLLKDGHSYQEITRRFDFWLQSTDPFVRQNRNSAGAFHNRFNELKTGPISNRGSSNGRAPFDDGAATVRAESESAF